VGKCDPHKRSKLYQRGAEKECKCVAPDIQQNTSLFNLTVHKVFGKYSLHITSSLLAGGVSVCASN